MHIEWFNWYGFVGHIKLMLMGKKHNNAYILSVGKKWMGREIKEISDDDKVLYLDKDIGYTGVFTHQNFSNIHLRFVHFIVCEYYIKQKKP